MADVCVMWDSIMNEKRSHASRYESAHTVLEACTPSVAVDMTDGHRPERLSELVDQ